MLLAGPLLTGFTQVRYCSGRPGSVVHDCMRVLTYDMSLHVMSCRYSTQKHTDDQRLVRPRDRRHQRALPPHPLRPHHRAPGQPFNQLRATHVTTATTTRHTDVATPSLFPKPAPTLATLHTTPQVIGQIWALLLGGLGLAGVLDLWCVLLVSLPPWCTHAEGRLGWLPCTSTNKTHPHPIQCHATQHRAGHDTPVILGLSAFGSFISYIYSAPPLKVGGQVGSSHPINRSMAPAGGRLCGPYNRNATAQCPAADRVEPPPPTPPPTSPPQLKQSGWIGNYALGCSYISLPWWCGQAMFGTLNAQVVVLTILYR